MRSLISPKLAQYLLFIFLIGGVYLTQMFYDGWRMAFARQPDVPENVLIEPHPLPSQTLKKVSFGLDNLIADIVWLQTIQYYGGGNPNGTYRKLPELLNTVTDMDSRFGYPYTFGLLVLPGEGFPKEAIEFGNKGMKNPNLEKQWEIPYYMGLTYHFNLKKTLEAAKLFDEAAKRPGAPPITRLMAANYYANANQRETAIALYYVIYKTTTNEYIKEKAKLDIEHWNLIISLEKAAKIFKQREGRYPETLQEMVTKRLVKSIPADPLGMELKINPKTGVVSAGSK